MFAANLTVAAHAFSKKFRSRIFPLLCLSLACVLPSQAQVQFVCAQSTVPTTGLSAPSDVAVDTAGNIYVVDSSDGNIIEIDTMGNQTSITVTLPPALASPLGIAVDRSGNLYVSDTNNNRVIKIPLGGGSQSTVGSGLSGPKGLTLDTAGNLFIADVGNGRIVKITAGGSQSVFASGFSGSLDDVAVDIAGNVYVTDASLTSVQKIPPGGGSQTDVGSGLTDPSGLAVDAAGDVYVVEGAFMSNDVVEVTSTGDQSTLPIAGLLAPLFPAVDANYNLFVPDVGISGVFEFSTQTVNLGFANVCFAGQPTPCSSQTATLNFTVTADTVVHAAVVSAGAHLFEFSAPASTCSGAVSPCSVQVQLTPHFPGIRPGAVLITDGNGVVTSVPVYGTGLGAAIAFDPPTVNPTITPFAKPYAVAAQGSGILDAPIYVLEYDTCQIFRTNILSPTPVAVAGNGTCSTSDALTNGVAATSISLAPSADIALDGAGNLYLSESVNYLVRKIDTTGIITTVAGNAGLGGGFSGDGGPATSAQLSAPQGITVDGPGNLYFIDDNNLVRKVDLAGIITTVAGSPSGGYGGDNGPATSALLSFPEELRADSFGNIYIADSNNNVVRKVDTSGIITTVAGNYGMGAGAGGNGGLATDAQLDDPFALAVDAAGEIFILDDNSLHRVDGAGDISIYSVNASLSDPFDIIADGAGNLAIADAGIPGILPVDRTTANVPAFGMQPIGTPTAAQDLTVTDSGNQSLAFSQFTAPTDFNLNGTDTSCSTSNSLGIGLDCILGIEFEPTLSGPLSESVSLTDNSRGPAAGTTQMIGVSGTGEVALTTTTTTLSSLPAGSSTFGQSVTFSAMVSPAPANSLYGTVQFFDGVTSIAAAQVVDSSGQATFVRPGASLTL